MKSLNLPAFKYKLKATEIGTTIFDPIRKKYVVLTPEEWVRQHVIHYLVTEKKYPASLLTIEKTLKVNSMTKRCDILAYNSSGNPVLLVECKAPNIKIKQEVFEQIARYNIVLKVDYLFVTNGMKHYCCEVDVGKKSYRFLEDVPEYKNIRK